MEIIVRRAELADLEMLPEFEQSEIDTERPFDVTLKRESICYYEMAAMLAPPHICVVVCGICCF